MEEKDGKRELPTKNGAKKHANHYVATKAYCGATIGQRSVLVSRYPDTSELQAIESWSGTPRELVEFIGDIWAYRSPTDWVLRSGRDGVRGKKVYKISFSTWGWSGNEEILGVLEGTWFKMLFWQAHRRGGHYEYEITPHWIDRVSPLGFGRILDKKQEATISE